MTIDLCCVIKVWRIRYTFFPFSTRVIKFSRIDRSSIFYVMTFRGTISKCRWPCRFSRYRERKWEKRVPRTIEIEHLLYIRHSKLDQIQDDLGKCLDWIRPTLSRITLRLYVVPRAFSIVLLFYGFIRHVVKPSPWA